MNVVLVCGLLSFLYVFLLQRWRKRQIRLKSVPPGPRGWPIVGNILDVPTEYSWLKYAAMVKKYGDIMYFEALGQPMLILSSMKRCVDILDKRFAADRPPSTMIFDLNLGAMTWNMGLMPYGERWRRRRVIAQSYFHLNTIANHYPVQISATHTMLKDILRRPSQFFLHVRKQTGTIILRTSYGYDVEGDDDALIRLAEDALVAFNDVTKQILYVVDIIPILKYIPPWFPGAGFRRRANNLRREFGLLLNTPFNNVKTQLASGVPTNASLATDYLRQLQERDDLNQEREETIRDAAAVSYAAGSDTTVSSILTFILAIALYPEVQKKAQAELDSIVGPDKLPNFEHKEVLPYIRCVLWETLRWQPVVPMGLPHSTMTEEVYDGYVIPAGTIVQPNVRAIFHDESVYPDPERFNPNRFMKEDGQSIQLDPTLTLFGFGRRICPGRYLAINTIWIAIASILATFTIEKALDENKKEIVPDIAYTPGLVSYPEPFPCRFIPRSEEIKRVLQSPSEAEASI